MLLSTLVLAGLVMPWFGNDMTGNANYAMVRGSVTTSDHHAIPNATVIAYSDVDVKIVRTNAQGNYYFMSLLPGVYFIRAYQPGQTAYTSNRECRDDSPVAVHPGLEYVADFSLASDCMYRAVQLERLTPG